MEITDYNFDLIVTHHDHYIKFFRELGVEAPVHDGYASVEDLEHRDIIGRLPLHMACHARSLTTPIFDFKGSQDPGDYSPSELFDVLIGLRRYEIQFEDLY